MSQTLQFWIKLYLYPARFFKTELQGHKIKYSGLVLILFCLGTGIDRMETQLVKMDLRGSLDTFGFLNTWPGFWLASLLAGAIGGYLVYLVCGWFYNVRVKWCQGKGDLEVSHKLYLYSNFFVSLAIVFFGLVETVLYPLPYDPYSDGNLTDLLFGLILIALVFHSVFVSYKGVTAITDVNRGRAILWFAVLPVLFYLVLYAALIILVFTYF